MYIILNNPEGNEFPLNANSIMRIETPEHYIDSIYKSKIIYLDGYCIYCYESVEEINDKILNKIKNK